MEKNYYEVLGVNQNAPLEEIRKKYKELVRKYHPDICKDKDATERIAIINCAYDILSNEAKRKKYDESLRNNIEYEDTVENEKNETSFDYEEEIKKYSEKEKEFAKRIALEKIIKEEISKLQDILQARIEVIKSVKDIDNIIEDYYFEQIEKWWEIASNYIDNLDRLKAEAEINNLNHVVPEINDTINKLNNDLQGTPLTILDAEKYIEDKENKERVLNEIVRDIAEIQTLLNNNTNLYDQILIGFINESNYDSYKEKRLYRMNGSLKKLNNMKKLAELYNLDKELEVISNLEEYKDELKKRLNNIPKDYKTARENAELYIYHKDKDKLKNEIQSLLEELRKLKSRMNSGVGNIVTRDEMKDIELRYKIATSKLSNLNAKEKRYNIDSEYSLANELNVQSLEYAYEEVSEQREKHINEFFDTYTASIKRKDLKGLLLHENLGLSGVCLVNATAATLNIINKNYLNISLPTTIILTGINVYTLKNKYKIYRHNYIKGGQIINSNECTKEEYKEYCLKHTIKK